MAVNWAPTLPEPTISDIEQTVQNGLEALRNAPLNAQITAALKFLTPAGYRPIAQFEEDGRKKRSTAAASNWNPETGEIVIYFEKQNQGESHEAAPSQLASAKVQPPASSKIKDEVKMGLREDPLTLSRAERKAATTLSIQADLAARDVLDEEIEQLCLALSESEKSGKSFISLKWFRDNGLTARGYAWADSLPHRQAVLSKAIDVGAITTQSIFNPKAPQHPTTTIKLNRESKYAEAIAPRFQPIQLRGGESASSILLRDRGRF